MRVQDQMLELDEKMFMKTEMGRELETCAFSWDIALREMDSHHYTSDEYKKANRMLSYTKEQWNVFQLALRQFYGIDYQFVRTDKYFGIVAENGKDWLFRWER